MNPLHFSVTTKTEIYRQEDWNLSWQLRLCEAS